jgi:hypothetical protein
MYDQLIPWVRFLLKKISVPQVVQNCPSLAKTTVSFTYLQQNIKGQINFLQNFIPNFFHVAFSIVLQSMTVPHKSVFSLWVCQRNRVSNSHLSCVLHTLPILFLISDCLQRRYLVEHKIVKLLILSILDRSGIF